MAFYKKLICVFCLIFSQLIWAAPIQKLAYNIAYTQHLNIHVLEKKQQGTQPKQVVILLAPLSIPSLTAFDVPGYSLMDVLANHGFDVWAIDFVGEGHASFPPSMQATPAPMGIYPLRAKDAVTQLHSAINFISQQTGVSQVSLLGWSWGSIVAAMYSADYPKQVQKLILYGSMYSATLPAPMAAMVIQPFQQQAGIFSLKLPAYQNIPWEEVHEHWLSMLQGKTDIVSPEAMDAVAKSYITIDPNPFIKHTLRRPMGPMEDLFYIWNQKPIYDISRVTVPTLVIYGDQDVFADHHLYSQLNHVKIKKQVVIPEATHWLIYEKGRIPFYKEIINFLKQSN